MCKQNVHYVFVDSQKKLGKACGTAKPVIACSIFGELPEQYEKQVEEMKLKIERIEM